VLQAYVFMGYIFPLFAHSELTFVRLTVSAVEAPKLPTFRYEPSRTLSGDRATGHGMCFRFDLCIPSHSRRSNGVAFLRRIFVRLSLPFCRYKVLKSQLGQHNIAYIRTAVLCSQCEGPGPYAASP